MLIDVTLLPTLRRAEQGAPEALVKMCDAYCLGRRVPKDYAKAKQCLIKITQLYSMDDIPQYGYGTLYYLIGDLCHSLGQHKEANEWYQKSIEFLRHVFIEDYANKIISDYRLEDLVKETALSIP